MKLDFPNRNSRALTIVEALVVAACVLILAAILFQMLAMLKRYSSPINCVSNMKQIGLAFRIWEGDHNNQFPMAVSVTYGGGMEMIETGNLAGCLEVVSNELSTTKILVCPADQNRTFATNWNDLNSSHISYFFSADASNDTNAKMLFSGDDNLAIDGNRVTSGLLDLSTNTFVSWYAPFSWFGKRHDGGGNLGMADGSIIANQTPTDLQKAFQGTGLATNRIAIP